MTQELFSESFENPFAPEAKSHCEKVRFSDNSKTLLLLDNCAAHPKIDALKKGQWASPFLTTELHISIQSSMDQYVLNSLKCPYKAAKSVQNAAISETK